MSAQLSSPPVLTFDFNEGELKEKDDKVKISYHGVLPATDRFGNDDMAAYIMGHSTSYLSLGTSDLLKQPNMSISMWLSMDTRVQTGKGYDYNPILIVKNGPGTDFINGLNISYDTYSNKLSTSSTMDSTREVLVTDKDTTQYNKWYHLVSVCNNDYIAFYINGRLQGKVTKNFETKFLATDSMTIGHSANTKNLRYMRGTVDDIQIFHRPLSDSEVLALYNAENPNRTKRLLSEALKYLAVAAVFGVIILLLIVRNRRALKKQREELELANKISTLELKAIKAQMNPHFISNSLAAIQELNYHADREKAGQYIAKFSFYLRQVLNYSDENYIPAEEEIQLIRLFVELEQLRFNNGFAFHLETDEKMDLKNTLVPSLITQPFIENAIWHGLLPLRHLRHPELTVSFKMVNGLPVISVTDNGVGRDPDATANKRSKGTRLAIDKIETLNRLSQTSNYKISILDLKDENGNRLGTQVDISLDNVE